MNRSRVAPGDVVVGTSAIARAAASCTDCLAALTLARETPGRFVACVTCGEQWAYTPPRARASPARRPPRAPPSSVIVTHFVNSLLSWDATVCRVERAAHGGSSPLAGVLAGIELGVLGTGCRGTRGVGGAPREDRDVRAADPRGTARYRALGRVHQVTADAVLADGQGDCSAHMLFARRSYTLTLAQRVGYRTASPAQSERWARALGDGNGKAALEGMEATGLPRLRGCAAAWFATEVT